MIATILGIPLLIIVVVAMWRATIGNLGKALDHGKEQWRDETTSAQTTYTEIDQPKGPTP